MTSAVSLTIVSTESVEEAGESALKLADSSCAESGNLGGGLAIASPKVSTSRGLAGNAPDMVGPSGK